MNSLVPGGSRLVSSSLLRLLCRGRIILIILQVDRIRILEGIRQALPKASATATTTPEGNARLSRPCTLLEGQTAEQAWKKFYEFWLRPSGPPQILLTDGGSEFEGKFARGWEQ